MPEKLLRSTFSSFPAQEPHSSNFFSLTQEVPKEPSLGCSWADNFLFRFEHLSRLFSSDILRFLQVGGAEVRLPQARVDADSNLKVTTVLEPNCARHLAAATLTTHPASPPLRPSGSSSAETKKVTDLPHRYHSMYGSLYLLHFTQHIREWD